MFRFIPEASDAAIADVSNALNEMVAEMPQILHYHHGGDVGMNAGNFDYVVVADFADAADYVAYRDDPGHQELIATMIGPLIAERAAVQYELVGD